MNELSEGKTMPTIEPIEEMLEKLQVTTIFGKPTKEGDVTLIPVAEVSMGFGYGYGFGRPTTAEGEEEAESPAGGPGAGGPPAGGAGAGGGGAIKPRGYIRIDPEGVTFEPIEDESRIAMAGIAMGAWTIFWITKTVRSFAKALGRRKAASAES